MSSSNKRQRDLARRKFERQQQRRADSAARRRVRQRITAIVVIAVLLAGAVTWIVVGRTNAGDEVAQSGTSPSMAPSPASSSAPSGSPSAVPSDTTTATASGSASASTAIACAEPGTPRADTLSYASAPSTPAPASATITLQTNCGDIVIETLPSQAPLTVASEVFLAGEGFYDQTSCHRLTTAGIYVLQCGDPKGDGTGGPGYAVPDENLPAEGEGNYPAGTIAMANAGPGTAGSQFFIVYQDTTLPSGYTIWGKVAQGLDIVQGVAAAGAQGGASDGPPAQPVFIEKAIVTTQ